LKNKQGFFMPPILFHIYGSIAIHSFGLMIALGLIITLYLVHSDKPLKKIVTDEQISTIFHISFIAGIAGGRILFLLTNPSVIESWTDIFTVWIGGLSILGAIIGIFTALTVYFYKNNLPGYKILDRITLYGPLLQSISRLGCFFAGCCYGKETAVPWGVIYENYDSLAPLGVTLHPTQLYSSLCLALIFTTLLCFAQYKYRKPGQIVSLYLMLISIERFVVDYWRGDQEFFTHSGIFGKLSIQQALAVALFLGALITMIFTTIYTKKNESI